LIVGHFAS